MNAAESTSMLKMTKISPKCAMSVGVMGGTPASCACVEKLPRSREHSASVGGDRALRCAPVGGHRTAPLAHVRFEFGSEVLDGGQRRRRRRVAERAQRLPRDVAADAHEEIDVAHLPFAVFDATQNLVQPV